jgi:outer membrane protein TolC
MSKRALALTLLVSIAAHAQSSPRAGTATRARALPRLSLKEAIARALTQNPTVLVQLQEQARAESQVAQVRAAALPTLTGNGLYSRIDGERTLTTPAMNGVPATTSTPGADAITANVTLGVPIIAAQRWVRWAQARSNARVAGLLVGDARRTAAVAVAGAYLSILTRRREIELNERARDTARAHADYTHTRLLGGLGSRLDDVRARQELEANEGRVVVARLALARAQETLGVLVAGDGPVDASEEPWFAAVDAAQAMEEAPRLRADLLALDARLVLARRVSRDSWADYMPTLSLTFAPVYTWPSTLFPAWSWQLQLGLTVPFYDGGLRYGLERERRALVRAAEAAEEGALRQARADLRYGDAATAQTAEALERARAAAQLAHEAVQIANLAYRAGATTNLELIDAERRARDADTAAAIAEDAARQARVDLLFAAGRLP